MGFWIALEDAKINNGCLFGVPKSHSKETDYFMVRSADNLSTEYIGIYIIIKVKGKKQNMI